MSEFDDPQLRDRLGRDSGAFPDANAAYAVVVAKVGRARRRRAVVVSTTTTAVLIVALLLGAAMRSHGDEARTLRPVDTSLPKLDRGPTTSAAQAATSIASTTTTARTTSTTSSTTSPSSTTTSTLAATTSSSSSLPDGMVAHGTAESTLPLPPAETIAPATPADTGAAATNKKRASPTTSPRKRGTNPVRGTAGPTTIAVPPTDPPDTSPVATSPPATDPPATSPPVDGPPANDPPARFETFSGIGGAVTVRLEHDTMQVVDKVPSVGFVIGGSPDVSGAHVEVRFFSGSHFTKVRVELVDGVMVPDVEERMSSSGSSRSPVTGGQIEHAPPSTDGDPSGGGSWHGGPHGPG